MDIRELPYAPNALDLFPRLLQMPRPALLHSADRAHRSARYDVMAADPEQDVVWSSGSGTDPFETIRATLPAAPTAERPHFSTGFIGYLGYPTHPSDPAAHPAAHPAAMETPRDPTTLPTVAGGIYRWSVLTDHHLRRTRLQLDPALSAPYRDALYRRLTCARKAAPAPGGADHDKAIVTAPFATELPPDAYRDAFSRVQEYIHNGDCYQINLAKHFSAPLRANTRDETFWELYRNLRAVQPGAFGAYLTGPWGTVLSFSPERFLRFGRGQVETRPIKGTRPRSNEPCADADARRALAHSGKDRAENLMIVDLMRNDLGRFCEPGSIQVERLFDVETMANVHHLVSTVTGRPRTGITALDALRAVFPGGSITGAPKIRATEIINELEPVGRSVFCGAIGYIDATGTMDTNIAIRTLVADPHSLHCWAGGGIVADSRRCQEEAEIEHKVGRLLQASSPAAWSRSCSSA